MTAKTAVYLRVSTDHQSCALQRAEVEEYLARAGIVEVDWFEDQASGTSRNRPNLNRLLEAVNSGLVSQIIVWKLDRFARSLKDLITLLSELQEQRVSFVSIRDNIDLSTAAGRLMTHIIASFAEFEAALIRERVTAGVRAARDRGVALGRPRLGGESEILSLRTQGLSYREISRRTGHSLFIRLGNGVVVKFSTGFAVVIDGGCIISYKSGGELTDDL